MENKKKTKLSEEEEEELVATPAITLHPSLHHPVARAWSEPSIDKKHLMYPLFVRCEPEDKTVQGFEPNKQWGSANQYSTLLAHLKQLHETLGLQSVMLFGVVAEKDPMGSGADAEKTNPVIIVTKLIKQHIPKLFIAVDVCMCEYTSHGHCGLVHEHDGNVINGRETVKRLGQIALAYAKAGCDMVCPSDMMDGRVLEIKQVLQRSGFEYVMIMSYTSKKASTMYSPFRLAVDSTFTGDRKRYQHPVGSTFHANRALERDSAEGADVVIVKPALFYGDIIHQFAQTQNALPIAAYVVSGEYVMLKMYGERTGELDSVIVEAHLSLLRAGVTILITYFTPELLKIIK